MSRLCRILARCRTLAGPSLTMPSSQPSPVSSIPAATVTRKFSVSVPLREDDATNEEETVVVSKIDHLHILSVGINRPKKRNCIDSATAERLHEVRTIISNVRAPTYNYAKRSLIGVSGV